VSLIPADVGKDDPSPETGLFLQYPDETIREVIDKKVADHPGKVIIEKTPAHFHKMDKIFRMYPDAKVVFVRRGAKATISSMLLNGTANGNPSTWNMNQCVLIYGAARRVWQTWKGDERVGAVFYEDLANVPELTVRGLFVWLGLDLEHVNDCIEANHRTPAYDVPGVLRKGTVDSWKEDLSEGQSELIDSIFEEEAAVA
tara:strand:+ start:1519 stop:2118 length:600 start_codon:yes stop_codon:yes gene_type:complete